MMPKMNVKKMVLCGMFTALICAGAYLRLPLPAIPMTLQTFFVILAGLLLGPGYGAVSVLVYLILGLAGLPVFTQGGGIGYVLSPTFGYIIGMAAAAYAIGKLVRKIDKPSFWKLFLACMAGTAIIYAVGLPYQYMIANLISGNAITASALLIATVTTILPGDMIKCAVCAAAGVTLIPVVRKYQ